MSFPKEKGAIGPEHSIAARGKAALRQGDQTIVEGFSLASLLDIESFYFFSGSRARKILWRSSPSSQIACSKSRFQKPWSCLNCSAIVSVMPQGTQFLSTPDRSTGLTARFAD
jgi:hypothetical protein